MHYAVETENARRVRRDREFSIAPSALLEAQRAAREQGLAVLGYYHSHPSGSAVPSALDLRDAWPSTSYVILGMENGEVRGLRSWRVISSVAGFVEEAVRCESKQP